MLTVEQPADVLAELRTRRRSSPDARLDLGGEWHDMVVAAYETLRVTGSPLRVSRL